LARSASTFFCDAECRLRQLGLNSPSHVLQRTDAASAAQRVSGHGHRFVYREPRTANAKAGRPAMSTTSLKPMQRSRRASTATPACIDLAIVGAGPYGLSIAAHLRDPRRSMRVFGSPMSSWRQQMPHGMLLKSEGFASNLSAPGEGFTLADYGAEQQLPYLGVGWPVPLSSFVGYGMEFQRRYVPDLEDSNIESLRSTEDGFELRTSMGESLRARRVVIAVGLSHFAFQPVEFGGISDRDGGGPISHSSQQVDPTRFRGQRVAVVGAGASALEWAALLHEAGAEVVVLARRRIIDFHLPPDGPRSLARRLLNPNSGLGPGWRSRLYADAPLLFHTLPERLRLRIVGSHLGPAPGWFVRDRVVGRVPIHLGVRIDELRLREGRPEIAYRRADGSREQLTVDQVITATGYRPALSRLAFIEDALRLQLRRLNDTPMLDRGFESSVRGLHFVGPIAANSFGPLVRFAYGADFTARRLARQFAVSRAGSDVRLRSASLDISGQEHC
jgi:thioredoxin reductase